MTTVTIIMYCYYGNSDYIIYCLYRLTVLKHLLTTGNGVIFIMSTVIIFTARTDAHIDNRYYNLIVYMLL